MKARHLFAVVAALLIVTAADIQQVSTQSSRPAVGSVSGSVSHGSLVTVAGSAFGTKSAARPLKYDDFQSVAVGSPVASSSALGPAWTNNDGFGQQHDPIASTTRLRPGTPFSRNMQSHWTYPDNQGTSNVAIVGQTFTKLYFDGWLYIDTASLSGMFSNNKIFRIHTTGAGAPNADMATPSGCGDIKGWVAAQRDGVARAGNDPGDWFDAGGSLAMCNNWRHVQWLIDAGSGGGATNGAIITYVDGVARYNHPGIVTTGSGQSAWQEFYVGNYINDNNGPWGGHIYQYWESVYVDRSWARVEIGDNSVYANCIHREIQPHESWSSTGISVRLNRGSFPNFSGLYLFVIDEQNNASAGFPLSGGGGGTPPVAPASPSNLRVLP